MTWTQSCLTWSLNFFSELYFRLIVQCTSTVLLRTALISRFSKVERYAQNIFWSKPDLYFVLNLNFNASCLTRFIGMIEEFHWNKYRYRNGINNSFSFHDLESLILNYTHSSKTIVCLYFSLKIIEVHFAVVIEKPQLKVVAIKKIILLFGIDEPGFSYVLARTLSFSLL